MTYPGTFSKKETIYKICDNLIYLCRKNDVKSICIPLLGCGVGKLEEKDVLEIFKEKFFRIEDIDIKIIINT